MLDIALIAVYSGSLGVAAGWFAARYYQSVNREITIDIPAPKVLVDPDVILAVARH